MSAKIVECASNVFIAYSYAHVGLAIKAFEKHPSAEAIVLQPREETSFFRSAHRYLQKYPLIPILITPQSRHREGGQYYEYGSRLMAIFDMQDQDEKKLVEGKLMNSQWVLQDGDTLYAKRCVLVVKNPIAKLSRRVPVSGSLNFISKSNRGTSVRSVSIPAPKIMTEEYRAVLSEL